MKKYTIIVAGGSGTRMKSGIPKQFLLLNGKPVLFYSIERFHKFNPSIEIILVLPLLQFSYWKKLCSKYKFTIPHTIIEGGKDRFHSVKNGLYAVKEKSIVAIHDGVRPLVKTETIKRCFAEAEKTGNAIPVIPMAESLRHKKKNLNFSVNRDDFFIVQTPQCFNSGILKKAYSQKYSALFTDDASVVESCGEKINMVEGNGENIKITTPSDLKIAGVLIKNLD